MPAPNHKTLTMETIRQEASGMNRMKPSSRPKGKASADQDSRPRIRFIGNLSRTGESYSAKPFGLCEHQQWMIVQTSVIQVELETLS